jgi:aminoglycoside phosphotransferase (APT) family kinase protein
MQVEQRLESWFAAQLPGASQVRVEGLSRVQLGHSAETLLVTLGWRDGEGDRRQDLVLRLRPPEPGLLEPYDLKRQFDILTALAPTPVRAPRALWFEPSGAVLGCEFYVMERLSGTVYERGVPDEIRRNPALVNRMCESLARQIAAIHTVDLGASGLDRIGNGVRYLDQELEHWSSEMARWQRGPLPALHRLVAVLHDQKPRSGPNPTLVHGDCKPGNFAFDDGEVTAVFDWEMATVGDPLADIGWAELLWGSPGYATSAPGALSVDEFVARWEQLTGIRTQQREWYRAFQALKMAVIMFVGGQLFDAGHSTDLRLAEMAHMVHPMTQLGLHELGIDEPLEAGPVLPRPERVREVGQAVDSYGHPVNSAARSNASK